jgi:lysophospholipase L1-like esterase
VYNSAGLLDGARPFGEVVVIALGYNDAATPGAFPIWIDELMAHVRDVPRVFWVNLRNAREWVSAANADLVAATSRWPNLRIIDWDARSTPDPFLTYGDGLHLNPLGQLVMGEVVARALDVYAIERNVAVNLRPPRPW